MMRITDEKWPDGSGKATSAKIGGGRSNKGPVDPGPWVKTGPVDPGPEV
jgi:hypothetical protein